MADLRLPEGVRRYILDGGKMRLKREGVNDGYVMGPDAGWLKVSDLPAIRAAAVEEYKQERRERGRQNVEVRDADWVGEQPLNDCWVTEDDHLNEVDAAVEEERERILPVLAALGIAVKRYMRMRARYESPTAPESSGQDLRAAESNLGQVVGEAEQLLAALNSDSERESDD